MNGLHGDARHETGGGTVLVAAGRIFRAGSIELRSNVELHIERGAVLAASPEGGGRHFALEDLGRR